MIESSVRFFQFSFIFIASLLVNVLVTGNQYFAWGLKIIWLRIRMQPAAVFTIECIVFLSMIATINRLQNPLSTCRMSSSDSTKICNHRGFRDSCHSINTIEKEKLIYISSVLYVLYLNGSAGLNVNSYSDKLLPKTQVITQHSITCVLSGCKTKKVNFL